MKLTVLDEVEIDVNIEATAWSRDVNTSPNELLICYYVRKALDAASGHQDVAPVAITGCCFLLARRVFFLPNRDPVHDRARV